MLSMARRPGNLAFTALDWAQQPDLRSGASLDLPNDLPRQVTKRASVRLVSSGRRLVAGSSENLGGQEEADTPGTPESSETAEFGDAVSELEQQRERHLRMHAEVMFDSCTRLMELQLLAIEENIDLHEGSSNRFLHFLRANRVLRRPYVFLLENGNVRAVWKGQNGEQIGLQFLSDGSIEDSTVQYVIFASRPDGIIARMAGRDRMSNIRDIVVAMKLQGIAIS